MLRSGPRVFTSKAVSFDVYKLQSQSEKPKIVNCTKKLPSNLSSNYNINLGSGLNPGGSVYKCHFSVFQSRKGAFISR